MKIIESTSLHQITIILLLMFIFIGISQEQMDFSGSSINTNVQFTDCGSTATIVELTIDPCPTFKDQEYNTGCQLRRRTTTHFTLRFKPAVDVTQAKHQVFGKVLVYVPFNGLGGLDACPNIQEGCPLYADNVYTYKSHFDINPNWPPIRVPIRYFIKDQNDNVLICFAMATKIV